MAKRIVHSFEEYYRGILGERWSSLADALHAEGVHESVQLEDSLRTYHLDPASVVAAEALPVQAGDKVLDMCAAPGGKSLILARKLQGCGHLRCNELSAPRRARLHRVLEECVPLVWRRAIQVSGQDASRIGMREKEHWDAILLDAPCSSERHVLQQPHLLAQWSPARIRSLAQRQHALLASAADALRIGGYLLYSTCALAPEENEGAVERLIKKRPFMEVDAMDRDLGELRGAGRCLWPDTQQGWGPIYYCRLRKK